MVSTERQIEAAAAAVSQQTDEAIAGIRAQLSERRVAGADECVDCGGEIGAARRAALPSARRCIACQRAVERGRP